MWKCILFFDSNNEVIKFDGIEYFPIGEVSTSRGGGLLITIEVNTDMVYFYDQYGKYELDFVNSDIEKFSQYLIQFCEFFKSLTKSVGILEEKNEKTSIIKNKILNELKLFQENLVRIDKYALFKGKYWHRFWFSNLELSFGEFFDGNEFKNIIFNDVVV